MNLKIYPLNDRAITVSFGNDINLKTHKYVRQYFQLCSNELKEVAIDIVPTYTNVTIFYNPKELSFNEMKASLYQLIDNLDEDEQILNRKIVHIPVIYHGEDLERVAKHNELTVEQVIDLHVNQTYLVYMIGFLPGFPYLGGLDQRLVTPRLDHPRQLVEAGSVGIANDQTGIYSIDSPGGWNIIGHTPVKIFDMSQEHPFLFEAGDSVQFFSVDKSTFDTIQTDTNYHPKVEWFDEN